MSDTLPYSEVVEEALQGFTLYNMPICAIRLNNKCARYIRCGDNWGISTSLDCIRCLDY